VADEDGPGSNEIPPADGDAPAAAENISLSQAILAPLDAVFKAQLHAARSFLSLLLQLGYPHQPIGPDGLPLRSASSAGTPYNMEFAHESLVDGKPVRHVIQVPALALVPVAPLAVQSAEFKFSLAVREVTRDRQMQQSLDASVKQDSNANSFSRPWFLISEPISLKGTLAPAAPTGSPSNDARIDVEVKVAAIPIPSGLDKLLTALTQESQLVPPTADGDANTPQ
jgi:hypothetical protein